MPDDTKTMLARVVALRWTAPDRHATARLTRERIRLAQHVSPPDARKIYEDAPRGERDDKGLSKAISDQREDQTIFEQAFKVATACARPDVYVYPGAISRLLELASLLKSMHMLAHSAEKNERLKAELARSEGPLRGWGKSLPFFDSKVARRGDEQMHCPGGGVDGKDPIHKEFRRLMLEELLEGVEPRKNEYDPTFYYAALAENLIRVADSVVGLQPRPVTVCPGCSGRIHVTGLSAEDFEAALQSAHRLNRLLRGCTDDQSEKLWEAVNAAPPKE
jgi:hypothetical protein